MSDLVSAYFSPSRGSAEVIVGFIDRCVKRLDVAVFNINHRRIVEALIRAHTRGVALRVLTDQDQADGEFSKDEALVEGGVTLRRDTQYGMMHNKFAVGDGTAVITGSFNWTSAADNKNAENFVIVRVPEIVTAFAEEFEKLWTLNATAPAPKAKPKPAPKPKPKRAPR